jgi:phospholipid/cholesterol/gamma-HCH transport system substrate-binding protein
VKQRSLEGIVGAFIMAAIVALILLAFKISGLTIFLDGGSYRVAAEFDNIGQLKQRAPVNLAGVRVGEVTSITLDPKTFRARVQFRINNDMGHIPSDSSASILTAGLLGDNYISLSPGYASTFLKEGSKIQETHPALILEEMIGQLLFQLKKKT